MNGQIDGKDIEKATAAEETTQTVAQIVSCCKAMDKRRLLVLVKKIATEDDANRAEALIQTYFESEVGAKTYNSIIVEVSGGKYPLKQFVNTSDKTLLYPQLERACINEAARQHLSQIRQDNVRYYVSHFMERWKRGGLQDNPEAASTVDSPTDTTKPKGRRGRPKTTPFADVILTGSPSNTLATLHKLLDGCKGKKVAMVVFACIQGGIIRKPTYTQVAAEFGDIGNKSGYNKALSGHAFDDAEIEGVQRYFEH